MAQFDLAVFDIRADDLDIAEQEEFVPECWVKYEGQFIGRFRGSNGLECANHFVAFLVENFTVEEYFALRQQRHPRAARELAPSEVLETKGFIDYNTLQSMKRGGFSTVRELLDSMMAAHDAARAAA